VACLSDLSDWLPISPTLIGRQLEFQNGQPEAERRKENE